MTGDIGWQETGVLHDVVFNIASIALLTNLKIPESTRIVSEAQEAARALRWRLHVFNSGTPAEIDDAFAALQQQRPDALMVSGDTFFASRRQQTTSCVS